jgi:hypothetical protein
VNFWPLAVSTGPTLNPPTFESHNEPIGNRGAHYEPKAVAKPLARPAGALHDHMCRVRAAPCTGVGSGAFPAGILGDGMAAIADSCTMLGARDRKPPRADRTIRASHRSRTVFGPAHIIPAWLAAATRGVVRIVESASALRHRRTRARRQKFRM